MTATRAQLADLDRRLFDAREEIIAARDLAVQGLGKDHPTTRRFATVIDEIGTIEVDLHRLKVRLVEIGAKRQTCVCKKR